MCFFLSSPSLYTRGPHKQERRGWHFRSRSRSKISSQDWNFDWDWFFRSQGRLGFQAPHLDGGGGGLYVWGLGRNWCCLSFQSPKRNLNSEIVWKLHIALLPCRWSSWAEHGKGVCKEVNLDWLGTFTNDTLLMKLPIALCFWQSLRFKICSGLPPSIKAHFLHNDVKLSC